MNKGSLGVGKKGDPLEPLREMTEAAFEKGDWDILPSRMLASLYGNGCYPLLHLVLSLGIEGQISLGACGFT